MRYALSRSCIVLYYYIFNNEVFLSLLDRSMFQQKAGYNIFRELPSKHLVSDAVVLCTAFISGLFWPSIITSIAGIDNNSFFMDGVISRNLPFILTMLQTTLSAKGR